MPTEYRTLARLFHADRSMDAFANHRTRAAGRLEADSTFRTGIVTPLGELFVAMPRRMALTLERVLLTEQEVFRLWLTMPGVIRWNYIRHYISEEIFASNEMEGVRSTRRETEMAVAAAERASATDGQASRTRFGEFARLYLTLTDRDAALPTIPKDIRDIYDRIALDEVDAGDRPDGTLFRKGDVEIQGPHGTPIHAGVSGEGRIEAMLTDMIRLVESDSVPRILSAIVSHFLFEYIHPFYDGNGRTGRYLLALYLRRDMTEPTALTLSRVIAENKGAYYRAFTEAEDRLNCGELTFFVETMLGFIAQAQNDIIDQLSVKTGQLSRARTLCETARKEHDLSAKAEDVLYQVMQEELFDSRRSVTLEDAAKHLALTKQSARKYVAELADAGLVDFAGKRPLRLRASAPLRHALSGDAADSPAVSQPASE